MCHMHQVTYMWFLYVSLVFGWMTNTQAAVVMFPRPPFVAPTQHVLGISGGNTIKEGVKKLVSG